MKSLVFVLLFFAAAAHAQEFLTPGDNLVVEGLPQVPVAPVSREIGAGAVQAQVAALLARPGGPVGSPPSGGGSAAAPSAPVAFVCEEDVRLAIAQGRTIAIGERTIVTPSARDLAQSQRVFIEVA